MHHRIGSGVNRTFAVAVLALVAALAGTAVAGTGPSATSSGKVKKALKKAKKANKKAKKAIKLAKAADAEQGPKGDPGAPGAPGSKGEKGDKGEPGATDVQVRQGFISVVEPNDSDDATADCPAGTVATGGGVRLTAVTGSEDLAEFHITRNAAEQTSGTPTSWRGAVYNDDENGDGDDMNWIVSVICASP